MKAVKMFLSFSSALTAFSILLGGLATPALAATNNSQDELSVSQFEQYLSNIGTADAQDTLAQFEGLTSTEQNQFLEGLTNGSTLSTSSSSSTNVVGTPSADTLSGIISPDSLPVPTYTYSVSWSYVVKDLGIPVTEYAETIKYEVNGATRNIKAIDSYDPRVVYNYNPETSIQLESKSVMVDSYGFAEGKATFIYMGSLLDVPYGLYKDMDIGGTSYGKLAYADLYNP